MKPLFLFAVVLLNGLVLTGCEEAVFDSEAAQGLIESSKLTLSGEQVLVSPDQIVCGEKKGLWIVDQMDGYGAIARLTDAGRALHFGDDIRMGERKFKDPYTQLQGDFTVKVQKVHGLTGEKPDEKIAEVAIGVVIDHECFAKPLALMGIDRGDFSEDVSPRIRLRQRGSWAVDQILH